MEEIIKNFINFRFNPTEIFISITVKKRYVLIQTIFISLLIAVPLSLGVYSFDSKYIIENIFPNISSNNKLQNELQNNSNLVIELGNEVIIKTNDYELIDFNIFKSYIVLRDSYVEISIYGSSFYGGYVHNYEDIISNRYEDTVTLIDFLLKGLTYNILSLLSILIYPITIILNMIFISFISLIAMMLNISSVRNLSFRQFFSLCVYSGTIPALVALLLGVFVSVAFVYVIYNFGLIVFAHYVYVKGQRRV